MLRSSRTHALALAALIIAVAATGSAARQYLNSGGSGTVSTGVVPEINDAAVTDANPLPVKAPTGGLATTPAGIATFGYVCTVPAYATGGTLSCLPDDGSATITATCAANAPCPLPALTGRRRAFFMALNAGTGVTATFGYGSAIAPGRGTPVSANGGTGDQGGSVEDLPAFSGTYYITAPAQASVRFVQG